MTNWNNQENPVDKSHLNAAEYCLYAGKTYLALSDEATAIAYFEDAQEKPAIMQGRARRHRRGGLLHRTLP
jgi:hypothetical protein